MSKTAYGKIRAGLERAIAHTQGRRRLTIREVELPGDPKPMTAREIASLRQDKLGVSQAVFAVAMNSSLQTVHAWEQGRTRPSGPALRLLRLVEEKPGLVAELLETGR
jgi:putative transcriptional regulator